MKKLFCTFLALMLVSVLAGCTGDGGGETYDAKPVIYLYPSAPTGRYPSAHRAEQCAR